MDNLKFSVIIPTYNRAGFILLALSSVLNQEYKNFEVIIIDDGSTDSTQQILSTVTDPRVKILKIENSERGAARNVGVKSAVGDYVTFLDSDDKLYPDYLSESNKGLIKYNFPVFYHQAYEVRNFDGAKVQFTNDFNDASIDFLAKGNPLSCIGIFIRRTEALEFPFNEDRDLSGSEDWELWLRLGANFGIKSGKKICACLVIHDDRSVSNMQESTLVKRKQLTLNYAFMDPQVQLVFGKHKNKIIAYSDTYNSLHLVISGEIRRSVHYLLKAVLNYPLIFFERRTLAIFKYIIIRMFIRS
jgi:glycosyltransferase involved in cell wall biosynthesis